MKYPIICVACGSTASTTDNWATRYLNLPSSFEVKRCTACGLRWLSPMPSQEDYRHVYVASYFGGSATLSVELPSWVRDFPPSRQSYEASTLPERKAIFDRKLDLLERLLPDKGRILDIGAATGAFLGAAVARGWTGIGIETSPYAADRARQTYGLDILVGDFPHAAITGTFDVIHTNHVFEHFVEPLDALNEMRRLMHPRSLMILEVPNQFDSWVRKCVRAARFCIGQTRQARSIRSIHHPYFYGPTNLRAMLRKVGFEVVSFCTHFPDRWRASLRRRILGRVEWIADLVANQGDNIEAVCRLPR